MRREPALGMNNATHYRLLDDPGSETCCFRDCDQEATCRVEGNGSTWSVMTTPLHPTGTDVVQAYQFCADHGKEVAEDRTARRTPGKV
jgi:hypothetical protein